MQFNELWTFFCCCCWVYLAYTIVAPHSSHGATFADCSAFGATGGWMGVVATGFGGKVATGFCASDFCSSSFTLLGVWNWLGVCERDNADAAPPTAWLAVQ